MPLVRGAEGTIEDEEELAGTIVLCESILALLPSFSYRDCSYGVMKAYNIMPLREGTLAEYNRIYLKDVAEEHGDGEFFLLNSSHIVRVWRPTTLPPAAEATARTMIKFLVDMKALSNRHTLPLKAAEVILTAFKRDVARRGDGGLLRSCAEEAVRRLRREAALL